MQNQETENQPDNETLKNEILDATIQVFNKKGLKFTMDDISRELNRSKKTLYTVFADKETLFFSMVDFCFSPIQNLKNQIMNDDSLSTLEKINKLLGALPEGFKEINFGQLYSLKEKFPRIYRQVEKQLESNWEKPIELIQKGIEEGVIRPVNVQLIKTMMDATLEKFFQNDVLVKNNISYADALSEVVEILMRGITKQA